MKKYRRIKITVKTREIVSLSKNSASETVNEIPSSVCPICHTPLSAVLPAAESSVAAPKIGKSAAELPPAEVSRMQEAEIKGDL